ncbi:MAG: TIR domain-containing protein [Moorea sp. SIO1G6]|uniref:TIR domain-containing protein n=1 Tax=Moorena sp. SIO1G6 TaxID=2607840 RepID=UPI0013C17567|nr:TIR domain-containing protein [Moorena sp. SIO1G6]NET68369.1 TIR domain-containing protein [Moorena sp. SIO1G6]
MHKTFISYSHKDLSSIKPLLQTLNLCRNAIWIDKLDIFIGEDWEEKIMQGINECGNFMYFVTANSFYSIQCQKELLAALYMHKRIFPCLLNLSDSEYIPSVIKRLQWFHFNKDSEAVAQLKAQLASDLFFDKNQVPFHQLAIFFKDNSCRVIPMYYNKYFVGRNPESNLSQQENGIIVNDPVISRSHLILKKQGEQWALLDISKNGVLVNQKRVTSEVLLPDNAEIQLSEAVRLYYTMHKAEQWAPQSCDDTTLTSVNG